MKSTMLAIALVCAGCLFLNVEANGRKLNQMVPYMSPNGDSCSCPDGHQCPQCPGELAICRNGQCQSGDVAEPCQRTSDCSKGLFCVAFKCVGSQVQTCAGPGADHCECSSHARCASGFCNPFTWKCQTMPCTSNLECSAVAPGTVCRNRQCWKNDDITTTTITTIDPIVPCIVPPILPPIVAPTNRCSHCHDLPHAPVCANNDKTYYNECEVACENQGEGWYITKRGPC